MYSKEIATKLFEHRIEVGGRAYFGVCVRIIVSAIHIIAEQIPGLSRTKLIFQDFPGPGNFTNTIPGLSRRRGNAVHPFHPSFSRQE